MQSARSASIIVIFAVECVSLTACNLIAVDDAERHPSDVFARIRSIDLLPRSVNPQEPNVNASDRRQAAIYTDENVIALASDDTRGQTKSVRGGSDGYELNFENTPVATVAKVVLGD
ncbi:MAG TPA: type II secretion system protein GspD, partial [Pseudolabrys sp.]|nr:type II secretion system protein GspD [Pseudolabrys sp.]